jgi:hypothetical protein
LLNFLPNRSNVQTQTDASVVGVVDTLFPNAEATLDVVYIKNPSSIWVNYTNMLDEFEDVANAVNVRNLTTLNITTFFFK